MTVAIVGLIGTLVGVMITQIGALLTDHRQVRDDAIRWNRDQTTAAFDNTLRYLLRASSHRAAFRRREEELLDEEAVRPLLNDLVEAQFWIRTLGTVCGSGQIDRITEAGQIINSCVLNAANHGRTDVRNGLRAVIATVTECAREDRRGPYRQKAGRVERLLRFLGRKPSETTKEPTDLDPT